MATAIAFPSPTFRARSREVLVAGFAGSLFSVGFSMYLFGVFQGAVVTAFATSVTAYAFAPTLSTVISGIL